MRTTLILLIYFIFTCIPGNYAGVAVFDNLRKPSAEKDNEGGIKADWGRIRFRG